MNYNRFYVMKIKYEKALTVTSSQGQPNQLLEGTFAECF